MNRKALILLAAVTLASPAMAQRYDRAVSDNPWNTSTNINGLRQDTSRVSVSFAELHGGMEAGAFRRTNEASSLWEAGAESAGIRHLDRFSMKGGFSFAQRQGEDMCGSMFITPGTYPVDVLEFTPGSKTLQTYAFDGGVSVDLTPTWRVGCMMDFESSNYSKRKDLRHTNYRLDMTFAPGVLFHFDDNALGLSYIYKRDGETVSAEQVGTGAEIYYAFLDKGLLYGRNEPWDGSGVHLAESGVNGFPVKRQYHGVALQWQAGGSQQELEYLRGRGSVGEKQSIWFRFPSWKLTYRWNESIRLGGALHNTRCFMSWERLSNYESVLEKVSANGITTITELAQNKIFAQKVRTLGYQYEYVGLKNEVLVGTDTRWETSTGSQMYPYLTTQQLRLFDVEGTWLRHCGRLDLAAGCGWASGKVAEQDSVEQEGTGVTTAPERLEDYYALEMEYKTARKLSASLRARMHLRNGMYFEARGSVLHGFGLQLAGGSDRYGASIGVGYEF